MIKIFGITLAILLVFSFTACDTSGGGGSSNNNGNGDKTLTQEDFYGTWIRNQGNKEPYTISITADSFHFEDNSNSFINHTVITWTAASNTATTHGADEYDGIFTGNNSNPSLSFPEGFTISGSRTVSGLSNILLPNDGFFIALSADRNSLYVAQSSSIYNRASFHDPEMKDSIFTRVAE